MGQPVNSAFDAPPPRMSEHAVGHWVIAALVFFSGPMFWALGNVIEWAFYNPSEGYRYVEIVHPMTQDRIARYWPWAVRVTLGINILLAFATYLMIRQEEKGGHGEAGRKSIEDRLIKVSGTIATTVLVGFFWASFGAVSYLILKSLF